jgi:nickel-dependent lactate racemase
MSGAELASVLGEDTLARYTVYQHDAREEFSLVHLGKTSRGTSVSLNRRCLEAGLIVLTGSVSFHYFAGFGGGRKTLFPGLAGYESIVANHRLTLGDRPGLHPGCREGNLEGNPVHEDIMEAFEMAPAPFVLNTCVAPRGGVVRAFAGEHARVFPAACAAARRAFGVSVSRKADLVIASCGGHPWDINVLQMHKALRNACAAARDGASVVLVGEARQGVGSKALEEGLRLASWQEADAHFRRSYALNGHTVVSFLQQAERVDLHLVSAAECLSRVRRATLHPDVQSALRAALEALDTSSPVAYYMPLAAITVPQ